MILKYHIIILKNFEFLPTSLLLKKKYNYFKGIGLIISMWKLQFSY